ncbi:hypothetical protein JCM3765_007105 [Sporobolomyces pararoseus]
MGHRAKNPTHIIKCLPRMSWSPANLYNLYQRTYGPPTADTKFTKSALTMFQQKWKAKQLVRAYHGDWIPEQKFKKGYLPNGLPPIVAPKSSAVGSSFEKVPLASMMFAEVEKRLDTVVFRCCLADSVYKARQMVIHGKVKLNGQKVTDANIKLQPGDLISVEPESIPTLHKHKIKKPSTTSSPSTSPSSESDPSSSSSSSSSVSAESPVPPPPTTTTTTIVEKPLRFKLPDFASPFLFIPPYLEPCFKTCSAVYLRHPTASPGISEVPSPYEADGEVMRLAWEYYVARGRKVDKRSENSRGKRLGA